MTTTAHQHSILPADMISVEDARARILAHFAPLPGEDSLLVDALGQVLAADVRAGFNIPPLDNTSMDGYAVHAADTTGATHEAPRELRVTGYLAAGSVLAGTVGPGEAVRIMTGAPIPDGADAVVPFEETDEQEFGPWTEQHRDSVRIDVAANLGANIRRAGEDIRAGETVMPAGTVLGPAHIGVLASLGLDRVAVHRRPRVAVLSTGDELLRPGEPLQPGKIYDANAPGIAAAVRDCGGIPIVLEVARDSVEALTARIHQALETADLVITSAGVSRGDFDVVKQVLANEGSIGFWTVNMRPGKPLAFGTFRTAGPEGERVVPHLGLPGNPVSALMTFELFGRPAVFTMLGKAQLWPRPMARAITTERIVNPDGRRFYARAIVRQNDDGYVVSLTGPQGSGVLTSMSLANGYAIVPEHTPSIEAGEACDVILLGPPLTS